MRRSSGTGGGNTRRWRGRGAILALMAVAAFLVWEWVLVLGPSNPVRRFVDNGELAIYDSHAAGLPNRGPDPRIVIVGMDDATLLHLPELDRPFYPLPRTYHAKLVDELFAAGAKVIGFDIMFTVERKNEDPTFAAALHHHGNVISALTPDVSLEHGVEHATFQTPSPLLAPHLYAASILLPGSRVRWFDPFQPDDGQPGVRHPHFGLALVAAYHNDIDATPSLRDTFHWGNHIDLPVTTLSGREQALIRFAGPANTYPFISYYEVYSGDWRRQHPDLFKGKIVLVGRQSDLEDEHDTPKGQMPGVEILANIAGMTLQRAYLRAAGAQRPFAFAALLMAAYLLILLRWTLAPATLAAAALAAGWWFVPPYLLLHNRLWMETLPPLLCLGTLLAVSAVYETARMRGQFRRFMPTWVADRVLADSGHGITAHSGDAAVERPVTVAFCDIRSFTRLSEQRPRESDEILRRFFEAGDAAARRCGTELDKYIGDEIMLYFFDRRGQAPHAERAVRWAREMIDAVREIDESGLAGEIGFRVGIGVASGVAREGFIGVRGRVQSTVMGDVVNLAARLQEATKRLRRPILMDETTFHALPSALSAEPLGRIYVKGKQEAVGVYSLKDVRYDAAYESAKDDTLNEQLLA